MDLHILGLCDAADYIPDNSTNVFRIFSSRDEINSIPPPPLQESDLYVHVGDYVFEDNDTFPIVSESGPKWFDETIAERMIGDYLESRNQAGAVLVHCTLGQNRSPGVGIAFNDLFDFGLDSETLQEKYPSYNRFVYQTLMNVGKRMNL
jgi:predicted protein tyrosine phosphatase